MATAVEQPVIIPQGPLTHEQPHSEGDVKTIDIDTSGTLKAHEQNPMIENLKQDTFMDIPSAEVLNSPPPPYSQQDYYLEQLLQALNTHLSQSNQKEKTGEMIDKMTQLESIVSNILSNQTFAMHDLKSQLSDIQTLLKKMQDKQETMTSEDIMKQVATMKTLTENIMASTEVKRHLDEGNTSTNAVDADPAEVINQIEEDTDPQTTQTQQIQSSELLQTAEQTIEEIIPPFEPSSPLIPTIVTPSSRPVSRTTSLQTSRAPSRAQSRNASRAPSRSVSRAVSPNRSPALSRSSSKMKLELPVSPQMHPFKGSMGPISENNDEEFSEEEDEDTRAFERMASILSTLITEATTAVEAPVKGREKKLRQDSNASVMSRDYFEDFDWDALEDDDASVVVDQTETGTVVSERSVEIVKEPSRKKEKDLHRRTKSRKEEEFQESFKTLDSSLAQVQCLISDMTDDLIMEEESVIVKDRNGRFVREFKDKNGIIVREEPIIDSTQELINNPSADLADLDDFAQQCRLLTRALILPFLHATHSFMAQSLQSSHQTNAPRSVTSTTRTFMNLMYWTFLFTLGSLVLDSWLCEVAGQQVIRTVDMLKPGQSYFVEESQQLYEIEGEHPNFQDKGMNQMDGSKKKNVKICTGFKLKSVSWRGVGMSVGSSRRWLRNSAQNVMSLGRRGRRLFTAGGWGFNETYKRSMLSQEWDDEMSEDSDEWEIVDIDSTDYSDDDSVMEGDSGEEDPALTLRRRITNERLKRAGHVKFITYNSNSDTFEKDGRSTIQKNNTTLPNEHYVDMQIEEIGGEQQTLCTNEASEIISNGSNLKSEPEQNNENQHEANIIKEDEIDDNNEDEQPPLEGDDVDLQIPGSFPAAFQWAPSYMPTAMDESSDKENVRRVHSVVLRRPKRNGPFGGSGGFWVMKTHKVRRKSKKGERSHSTKKEKNASDLLKSSNTKSSPISKKKKSSSKRAWIRRNSI